RDLEQAATDLQDRPERIEPCDAVPRAAAELHVQVGLQTSPHSSHGLTSVRRAPHVSKGDARRQAPPDGPLTLRAQPSVASPRLTWWKTGGRRPTTLRPDVAA